MADYSRPTSYRGSSYHNPSYSGNNNAGYGHDGDDGDNGDDGDDDDDDDNDFAVCEAADFQDFNQSFTDAQLDALAQRVIAVYRAGFPDAIIFPVVGFPSNNKQRYSLMTFTPTRKGEAPNFPAWNEYIVKSPLDNNGLMSFELSQETGGGDFAFSNRFEIMLPDIRGNDGGLGSTEFYVQSLQQCGIGAQDARNGKKAPVLVNGNHYHWPSTPLTVNGEERTQYAIHSSALGLDPVKFAKIQTRVLLATLRYIDSLSEEGSSS